MAALFLIVVLGVAYMSASNWEDEFDFRAKKPSKFLHKLTIWNEVRKEIKQKQNNYGIRNEEVISRKTCK